MTKEGINLTRKLGLFLLINNHVSYIHVSCLSESFFLARISALYTPYLIASSSTQLSMTWYKGTSVVDDSGVYTCLYTTYPDPVSVSVYATVIAQGGLLRSTFINLFTK